MEYPKRVIVKGEKDKKIVKEIQKKLNENGCGPVDVDGGFGPKTFNAVKLFQSRFTDQQGRPLIVDGKIGPISWAALFNVKSIGPEPGPLPEFAKKVLAKAKSQIGVVEKPRGSNSGPEVDAYLKSVGLGKGYAWCAAFVYWCYDEVSKSTGIKNPVYKTAGVMNHWNNTKGKKITSAAAVANPSLIKPGQVFIMSYGGGLGHTGIVESVNGGYLTTIEGNTNEGGSREGIGVFRRTGRKVNSINRGFIEY